ncbi:MAG: B12-binding domain-containing radical SAM protein [Candidatus Magnetomorum sp.]|nr:B12-binding domain-containing radical SAM protein [Candidatus Magnetomorum sp.]
MIDSVLIHPGDKRSVYQNLGESFSAIEPPIWCAMIASNLRKKGFEVQIIDANAENVSPADVADRIHNIQPLLVGIMVTGVHPSASTQTMPSALKICQAIKSTCDVPLALAGLHPTALPHQTLKESAADFVIEGDGMVSFAELLYRLKNHSESVKKTPGLWFYSSSNTIQFSFKAPVFTSFPNVSWDLLPMSLYQAHNWQCLFNVSSRKPYASIYTSIGCPYHCKFCCVHTFWQSHQVNYRKPDHVLAEIDDLVQTYGIKYLKIADENFLLHQGHYLPIVKQLIRRQYQLNIWIYGRIDAIRYSHLSLLRQAGIRWIALGIESADASVLNAVAKPIGQRHIIECVKNIQDQGICVMGNFVFGLPEDRRETLQATLDLAQTLNCEFVNFNCMMPYPGTIYYEKAIQSGTAPPSWEAYSQHAYETQPLPTSSLSSRDVLEFRDHAFTDYFSRPSYLKMIQEKFGLTARQHIEQMIRTTLKRKLVP